MFTNLGFLCLLWAAVVQKVDNVSEGMENYGGKIIAVETDLKKLGEFHSFYKHIADCSMKHF